MSRITRVKWAKKLMGAKYFVVLTDTESVIALEGANPENFDDIIALQSQGAALADFHSKLGELVKDHEKAAKKLLNVKVGSKHAATNTKSKVKKIKVRQE